MSAIKLVLYGAVTWAVPFVVSFFLFSPQGELLVSQETFDSIMTVVGTAVGIYLLYRLFKQVNGDYIKWGLKAGLLWFLINIILDVAILVPMSKMSIGTYFARIAIGYLSIPIMGFGIGYLLEMKSHA